MQTLYVTHPQVRIEAHIPVPQWGLSDIGRERAEGFAARELFTAKAVFVSSTETKALELANILASSKGNSVIFDEMLGENDRSATGFLPPDDFEIMADRFFASPDENIEGWERAVDAQERIVTAVARIQSDHPDTALVFCGHGAVGTLLKCHVANRQISRKEDQPAGGGNVFAFDLASATLICDWTPMEMWNGYA